MSLKRHANVECDTSFSGENIQVVSTFHYGHYTRLKEMLAVPDVCAPR